MVAERVGEEPLVVGLVAVVELLGEPLAQLARRAGPGRGRETSCRARGRAGRCSRGRRGSRRRRRDTAPSPRPRSPECVTARCTCPIDAAAIGSGSHCANRRAGFVAELGAHDLRGRARATSAARPAGATPARRAPARAGRRRDSSPSGRSSSTRPSCCRARRRPARRVRSWYSASSSSRRSSAAVASRARCTAYEAPDRAPTAASCAFRAARLVPETGAGRLRRRRAITTAPGRDQDDAECPSRVTHRPSLADGAPTRDLPSPGRSVWRLAADFVHLTDRSSSAGRSGRRECRGDH